MTNSHACKRSFDPQEKCLSLVEDNSWKKGRIDTTAQPWEFTEFSLYTVVLRYCDKQGINDIHISALYTMRSSIYGSSTIYNNYHDWRK